MTDGTPALPRTLVLVGLMGAGKTAVGRRLAARLRLPFVDADQAIETAAGCSIEDIFEIYGEPAFRDVERRVLARLMHEPVQVLSTGGGAFMDPGTRAVIAARGISLWLKADLDLLVARTSRRGNRPLLKQGDPRATLGALLAAREPTYALADITVTSQDGPLERTVDLAMAALEAYLTANDPGRPHEVATAEVGPAGGLADGTSGAAGPDGGLRAPPVPLAPASQPDAPAS